MVSIRKELHVGRILAELVAAYVIHAKIARDRTALVLVSVSVREHLTTARLAVGNGELAVPAALVAHAEPRPAFLLCAHSDRAPESLLYGYLWPSHGVSIHNPITTIKTLVASIRQR
jgi:hypothetical protein